MDYILFLRRSKFFEDRPDDNLLSCADIISQVWC